MSIIYIYGLADPFDYFVRYVGQSDKPPRRYREHLNDDDDTPKCDWIRNLKRRGVQPMLVVLDACEESEADALEAWWIKFGTQKRWQLTNSTLTGVKRPLRNRWRITLPVVDKGRLIEWMLVGLLLALIFVAVGGY